MPLNPATLTAALMALDNPASLSPAAAAEAWFSAWWKYAKEMTFWNPLVLADIPIPGEEPVPSPAETAARLAFIPAILPGLAPVPAPGAFFLALEAAMALSWVAATTPLPPPLGPPLLPAYLPVPLVYVPGPIVLQAGLMATVPVGLASLTKEPSRTAIATAISTWTLTSFFATTPGPATTPIL